MTNVSNHAVTAPNSTQDGLPWWVGLIVAAAIFAPMIIVGYFYSGWAAFWAALTAAGLVAVSQGSLGGVLLMLVGFTCLDSCADWVGDSLGAVTFVFTGIGLLMQLGRTR